LEKLKEKLTYYENLEEKYNEEKAKNEENEKKISNLKETMEERARM